MVSAVSSALSGLQAAGKRIEDSAQKIASSGTENHSDSGSDKVTLSDAAKQVLTQSRNDPADAIVQLQQAANEYKANLKTLKVQQDTLQSLLDIKA